MANINIGENAMHEHDDKLKVTILTDEDKIEVDIRIMATALTNTKSDRERLLKAATYMADLRDKTDWLQLQVTTNIASTKLITELYKELEHSYKNSEAAGKMLLSVLDGVKKERDELKLKLSKKGLFSNTFYAISSLLRKVKSYV